MVARGWEAEARAQRARLGRTARRPILRVRHSQPGIGAGPLTQKEVGLLLGMSERSVRAVERRAFKKLFNHPLLRQVWRQCLAGELDEEHLPLTPEEIEALVGAARTSEERLLIEKVLRLVSP
jgi:hypothetical protein